MQLIDRELDRYAEENRQRFNSDIKVLHMWDAESGMIDSWHKYCQKQMRDSFHTLDDKLIFSNTETNKKDYASKKLNYPLEAGDLSAYEKLMSTLYSEEERTKIEWAIGSIVLRKCSTWLMIAVDVNRIPILMNYCRSELDFGAVTMQWFKRTAKSPKYH